MFIRSFSSLNQTLKKLFMSFVIERYISSKYKTIVFVWGKRNNDDYSPKGIRESKETMKKQQRAREADLLILTGQVSTVLPSALRRSKGCS